MKNEIKDNKMTSEDLTKQQQEDITIFGMINLSLISHKCALSKFIDPGSIIELERMILSLNGMIWGMTFLSNIGDKKNFNETCDSLKVLISDLRKFIIFNEEVLERTIKEKKENN